jgi:hypothetical protein
MQSQFEMQSQFTRIPSHIVTNQLRERVGAIRGSVSTGSKLDSRPSMFARPPFPQGGDEVIDDGNSTE